MTPQSLPIPQTRVPSARSSSLCPENAEKASEAVAGGQGKELYEALRCPKNYVLFTAEEGADGHCEGGAQVLFHRVAYDWLDKTLATSSASDQKPHHTNFGELR